MSVSKKIVELISSDYNLNSLEAKNKKILKLFPVCSFSLMKFVMLVISTYRRFRLLIRQKSDLFVLFVGSRNTKIFTLRRRKASIY